MNKNEEYLRNLEVTPIFYYLERTAVCLLVDKGGKVQARGVAICSPSDRFIRRVGRAKAMGRALKAIITGRSQDPINDLRWSHLQRPENAWHFKADLNPELRNNEELLLKLRRPSVSHGECNHE